MKKLILLLAIASMSTACSFGKDQLEDSEIYTTIYPISYLMEELYGEYADIKSIYPNDDTINVNDYKLTDKQIKEYAECDLFVYNGTINEKNIAKEFINENKDILIIDAAHSLNIENSVEELWLSPNNFLMLAKNIKNNLLEYVERVDIVEDINNNYNELAETLSLIDADLRKIGQTAISNNSNVLIISSDSFKFLENYGFTIISLEDEANKNDDTLNNIKTNLENGNYLAFINEYGDTNELSNKLISDSTNVIYMNNFNNASDKVDYISTMHEFISTLDTIVNK